ncbi:MAG: VOC family protein [Jiangellaceae bacterium]
MPRITPNLWFSTQAEEAVRYYIDALGDGAVRSVMRYGPESPELEGTVMTVDFELFGQPFAAINGGPQFADDTEFTFNEAISLEVVCETQDEVNRCWDALVVGGRPGLCGWLTDRYGVAWQVTPRRLRGAADRRQSRRCPAGDPGHAGDQGRAVRHPGAAGGVRPRLLTAGMSRCREDCT